MSGLFQSSLLEYQVANPLILQIRKLRAECAKTHNSHLLAHQLLNQSLSDSKADICDNCDTLTVISFPYSCPVIVSLPYSHSIPQPHQVPHHFLKVFCVLDSLQFISS